MKLVLSVLIIMMCVPAYTLAAPAKIDRLFSTPEQRAYLDKLRQQHVVPLEFEQDVVQTVKLKSKPVVYNGFVVRHNGTAKGNDVWVNGERVNASSRIKAKDASTHSIIVKKPESQKTVKLKPGQIYDNVADKIIEAYQSLTTPSALIKQNEKAGQ